MLPGDEDPGENPLRQETRSMVKIHMAESALRPGVGQSALSL